MALRFAWWQCDVRTFVRERLIGCSSFFVKPSCSIQKNDLGFDQKTQLVQFIRRFIRRTERVRRYEWKGL